MKPTLGRTSSQQLVVVASLLASIGCSNEAPTAASSSRNPVGGEVEDEVQEPVATPDQPVAVRAATDVAQPVVDTNTDAQAATTGPQYAAKYSQYIAFGDSFTSGFGLSGVNPKSCAQSQTAWPPLVNKGLGITTPLIFPACSGATTQDILAQGPDVAPGYQTGPQIDQLPNSQLDSALITIQIGGNDLKLGESVQECLTGLNELKMTAGTPASLTALGKLTPKCGKLDWLLDNFSAIVEESLEPSLEYTFSSLRAAAPNATIVAVGYPHLVDATSNCRELLKLFVNATYRQRMNALADALNAKIASAAATAGIRAITDQVVSTFRGHEMCSAKEWVSSTTVHPNAEGHRQYAKLVINGVPAVPTRTAATDVEGLPAPDAPPPTDGTEGVDMPGQPEVPGPGEEGTPLPQDGDLPPAEEEGLPFPQDDGDLPPSEEEEEGPLPQEPAGEEEEGPLPEDDGDLPGGEEEEEGPLPEDDGELPGDDAPEEEEEP